MVKPHHWKHILPHHVTLWPGLSWAAAFPMADSDTDSERCRTTALGWHSWRSCPDPATDPWLLSLLWCVCMCQESVQLVCMHVYAHAKCAWVCKDKSLTSRAPIRAPSKRPGDIYRIAGRGGHPKEAAGILPLDVTSEDSALPRVSQKDTENEKERKIVETICTSSGS